LALKLSKALCGGQCPCCSSASSSPPSFCASPPCTSLCPCSGCIWRRVLASGFLLLDLAKDAGFDDFVGGFRVKNWRIDSERLEIDGVSHLARIEKQVELGTAMSNHRARLLRCLAFLVNPTEPSVGTLMHSTIMLHVDRAQNVLKMLSALSTKREVKYLH
jgi:hypothetical protein